MARVKTAQCDVTEGRKPVGWLALLMMVTALIAAGCSALAEELPASGPEERQPFSSRREAEDGAVAAWSGYVDGYEPGMETSFDVSINNQTDEAWPGRFCLQLMDDGQPRVLATLEQRPFNLQPGLGFSDTITVALPEGLDEGPYGLSLVVRGPHGPTVDRVSIDVGGTDAVHQPVTQRDMDAALEACPAVTGARAELEDLLTLAREDLAAHAGVGIDEVVVESVSEAEFADASLGVPEPDQAYAQVITPGFVIRLEAEGTIYEYHAAGERVVLAVEGVEEAGGG